MHMLSISCYLLMCIIIKSVIKHVRFAMAVAKSTCNLLFVTAVAKRMCNLLFVNKLPVSYLIQLFQSVIMHVHFAMAVAKSTCYELIVNSSIHISERNKRVSFCINLVSDLH
jgi:hypothetical protein